MAVGHFYDNDLESLFHKYHYVTVFSQDGFLVMHAPGAAERDNTPVIVG